MTEISLAKQLCVEAHKGQFRRDGDSLKRIADSLVKVLNAYEGKTPSFSFQGQAMDGYSALNEFIEIAKEAREAMKQ